ELELGFQVVDLTLRFTVLTHQRRNHLLADGDVNVILRRQAVAATSALEDQLVPDPLADPARNRAEGDGGELGIGVRKCGSAVHRAEAGVALASGKGRREESGDSDRPYHRAPIEAAESREPLPPRRPHSRSSAERRSLSSRVAPPEHGLPAPAS